MVDVVVVLGAIGGAIVGAVTHRQWVRRSPDKLEELTKQLRTQSDSESKESPEPNPPDK